MKHPVHKILSFAKKHKKLTSVFIIILFTSIYLLFPKPKKDITTVKVQNGTITQTISATGKIQSQRSVDLSFITGGKLAYIGVEKGEHVAKFQTIATLDQRSVQKKLENALKDYSLQRNAYEDQQDSYDNRKPSDATSDAMRRILENNQHNLDKAVISVELQDLAKQDSVLVSPIDGILLHADVDSPGANVTTTSKFIIADPSNLVFKTDVDEADIGKVKIGQNIEIVLDSFPDKNITLPINYIDFASHDTSTGGTAYTVEAKIPNNSHNNYRIGMNGDASITINEKRNVLKISIACLLDDKYVYVKENGKFNKKTVKKGLENDLEVEIVSGLKNGEVIALQPQDLEPQSK